MIRARSHCQEDWVEIYNVHPGGREVLLGRYCGDATPGPVESEPGSVGLKASAPPGRERSASVTDRFFVCFFSQVIFHTDEEGVFNGFKARYLFDENSAINRGKRLFLSNF